MGFRVDPLVDLEMGEIDEAWKIAGNRELFEKVHQLKVLYESILLDVANRVAALDLGNRFSVYNGSKVSKGNELEKCPYQVLDVVRDFDLEVGLNVRLLHWWGRGTFIFLFVGRQNSFYPEIWRERNLRFLLDRGYFFAETVSLWHYKTIIDARAQRTLSADVRAFIDENPAYRLQLVKSIVLAGDRNSVAHQLFGEVKDLVNLLLAGEDP
ncbi:hypothetical protein ADIS_2045 [Lunatimonas lonarensis]|uniref:Uncharacterized protein n=1 Tax=Lunatimonas lonarensis TaxID=1232681 RepID=R7ZTR5_9BACT|nr:hypothetical protein [Lunatimonas lonarensis]EON77515.1 hypothetical protein ADIS_2045 [Lunatimonas lonarensis]